MTTTEPTRVEFPGAEGTRRLDREPSRSDAAPHAAAASGGAPERPGQVEVSRHSPDPAQGTDRYRLVTPFTLRL